VVDVEITRNMKEKEFVIGAFDDAGVVALELYATELPMMLRIRKSGGVISVYELLGHVTYCLYRYFIDFVDFPCLVRASQLVEPAQASSLHFNIMMLEADVVNSPSSDTEEALDLLFLSPAHGPLSPASNPCSGSDSDMFKDWPKVNDMTASVYVALTTDALSSHASTVDTMCGI
jgi:hypothetical protein